MSKRQKSLKSFTEMCTVFPGGVNSPVRSCQEVGTHPLIIDRADGAYIYDIDDNKYFDFCNSWGVHINGHLHPHITRAIASRLNKGTSYGIPCLHEKLLADKIKLFVPSCEKLRFVSSGTESTMSAVRVARGYTKKNLVIKFAGNYHGHSDQFLIQAGSGVLGLQNASSDGIPQDVLKWTLNLPYNDQRALKETLSRKEIASNLAAIIVEPVACNMGVVVAEKSFLELLREETEKHSALLIFDEVITGFRLSKGGAQEYYGIIPDLSCFAKIIGGGLPCAAFGGKKEIMDVLAPNGAVYQAGTLSGNPLAMGAGLAALELLERPNFYEELLKKTERFVLPLKEFIEKNNLRCTVNSVGSLMTIFFGVTKVTNLEESKKADREMYKKLYLYMLEHGIYIPPSQFEAWFFSIVQSDEEIDRARKLVCTFLQNIGV